MISADLLESAVLRPLSEALGVVCGGFSTDSIAGVTADNFDVLRATSCFRLFSLEFSVKTSSSVCVGREALLKIGRKIGK